MLKWWQPTNGRRCAKADHTVRSHLRRPATPGVFDGVKLGPTVTIFGTGKICVAMVAAEGASPQAGRKDKQFYILRQVANLLSQFVPVPLIDVGPIKRDLTGRQWPQAEYGADETGVVSILVTLPHGQPCEVVVE